MELSMNRTADGPRPQRDSTRKLLAASPIIACTAGLLRPGTRRGPVPGAPLFAGANTARWDRRALRSQVHGPNAFEKSNASSDPSHLDPTWSRRVGESFGSCAARRVTA